MTLDNYLKTAGITAKEFAKRSGVSYNTVKSVRRGLRLRLYDKAERISKATGGMVSIAELCEVKG